MNTTEIKKYKVCNMPSYKGGNEVPNQFIITIETDRGTKTVFQSYKTVIAVKDEDGNVTLDKSKWNYSSTTSNYRNRFLGEKTDETRRKIKDGVYKLADLN